MSVLEDELGDIIAKARVGQGLTVEQLAAAVRVPATEIERVEGYTLRPESDTLCSLAEALSLNSPKLLDAASDGWSPNTPSLPSNEIVDRIEVKLGQYSENSYIIGCPETGLGGVVDPGGAVDAISEKLKVRGLKLDVIMVTHAHADHIGALKQLALAWPQARVVNHQLEMNSIMNGLKNQWGPAKDGISFHIGNLSVTPLFTPGHTPGSVCYHVGSVCFVGDTIFAGSIGRPAGQIVYKQMLTAIKSKILALPDDTVLLPGHGPSTSVCEEKSHNPFF